jgi:hypothetical protein
VETRIAVIALTGCLALACQPKTEAGKQDMAKQPENAAPAAGSPKVEITEPAEGATVTSPVKVVLQTTGVEIVAATDERPGTGHHHLFVDQPVTAAGDTIPRGKTGIIHLGRGQTEFSLDSLKPGAHTVIDVVGDSKHIPLNPMVADTVHFTVQAPAKTAKPTAKKSTSTTKKR